MIVTVEIPESVARALAPEDGDLSRALREAIALEGYRTDRLTEYEIQQLLGLESRMDVHGFLKEHGVHLNYSLEELKHDITESNRFSALKTGPTAEQRAG